MIKLIAYGVAAIAVLSLVGYGLNRVYDKGGDERQAKIEAQYAKDLAKATAETARVEAEREKQTQEIQDDLLAKLSKTDTANRDLTRRLRDAFRSGGAVPQVPGSPPSAPGPTGIGSDESPPADRVGEALNDHLTACDRDGIRLLGFQEWYNLMRGAVP